MSKGRAAVRAGFKLKGTSAPPPLSDLQASASATRAATGSIGSMTSSSGSSAVGSAPVSNDYAFLGNAKSNVRETQKIMQVHAGRKMTNELYTTDATTNAIIHPLFFVTLGLSVFVMGQMISGRGKNV